MIDVVLAQVGWFAGCALLFGVLVRPWALHRAQPILRRDLLTDVVYWFGSAIVCHPFYFAFLVVFLKWLGRLSDEEISQFVLKGRPSVSSLPFVVQFLAFRLVLDLAQYWIHRAFHQKLWSFHAVHHSGREIDWLTGVRFHPVNTILSSMLVGAAAVCIGFSPAVAAAWIPIDLVYSGLLHANVNWSFGPLKYVFVSPVLHRWHHTLAAEGGAKNFAPTLSFIDVLFGTFYLPSDRLPERYGVDDDDVPSDVVGQLLYPFRTAGKSQVPASRGGVSA